MKINNQQIQQTIIVFLFLFFATPLFSQNSYKKGWQALDNADVEAAIKHFQAALKDKTTKADAQLCLTLLESNRNREQEASKLFNDFFDNAENPYPELYALWFTEGVIGETGKKLPHQLDLLKRLENAPENKGKLDAATSYRLLMNSTMSSDNKTADEYFAKMKTIDTWELVGPFDNVINSGYNKEVGVLANPQVGTGFTSKYGTKVDWFNPQYSSREGYFFKDLYFYSTNSIVYAQSFVEIAAGQEDVLMKIGYSGSLKLWINDDLVYNNPEHRVTDNDYYQFNCRLNKGYNRILVQLGDYEEVYPNFTLRLTDLQHNALNLPISPSYQAYTKGVPKAEALPFFAVTALQEKAKNATSLLYPLLLAKAYMRSNELDKAEKILLSAYEKTPKNFLVLRTLILLHDKTANETNRNKFYELFEDTYPLDRDILINKLEEYIAEKDKSKTKETIQQFLSLYGTPQTELSYDLVIASLDNDNEKILSLIDELYDKYPNDSNILGSKYRVEKNFRADPKKANRLLENYLKENYSYSILSELANNYFNEGDVEKTIDLYQKYSEIITNNVSYKRKIVNLLSRQFKYDEAIAICKDLLIRRPSDHRILNDLAHLYTYKDEKKKAIKYHEASLSYYPFTFETTEDIRDLQGKEKIIDSVKELDYMAVIEDFNKNFNSPVKQSYDIVLNSNTTIVNSYKAKASVVKYILRLNDEPAIEEWKHMTLGPGAYMTMYFDEVKTIKKNGQKIDADRNEGEVVFTNLEVGDFIYISYYEKQTNGGKSALFINDDFAFSSYTPYYKMDYNLILGEGISYQTKMLKEPLQPSVKKLDGYTQYNWSKTNPTIIKDELVALPFSDVASILHVSLDYTWKDIVQWYSDLSSHQAASDFTIQQLADELIKDKGISDEEKAKIIYDFVCKTIQYSSIDFRQSGYIPQKAATTYHSRLGDCKDVSTLYVAIARSVGLKANLVLINTRDNGANNIVLPSLNFNHCIVKVYLNDGSKYLELTDKDLAYGQLYYAHEGAAILEIPIDHKIPDDVQLEYLQINPGYPTTVERNTTVKVLPDNTMTVSQNAIKTGSIAAAMVSSYYYLDKKALHDQLQSAIASDFESTVSLEKYEMTQLEPLNNVAKYSYSAKVANDVLKLGSMKSIKLPFSDILIKMKVFEDDDREKVFNFQSYENTDQYIENFTVVLDPSASFKDLPKNINATFNKSTYAISYELINDYTMEIKRVYTVNREDIQPEDFAAFKDFMTQVNEGENTHLLFQ